MGIGAPLPGTFAGHGLASQIPGFLAQGLNGTGLGVDLPDQVNLFPVGGPHGHDVDPELGRIDLPGQPFLELEAFASAADHLSGDFILRLEQRVGLGRLGALRGRNELPLLPCLAPRPFL